MRAYFKLWYSSRVLSYLIPFWSWLNVHNDFIKLSRGTPKYLGGTTGNEWISCTAVKISIALSAIHKEIFDWSSSIAKLVPRNISWHILVYGSWCLNGWNWMCCFKKIVKAPCRYLVLSCFSKTDIVMLRSVTYKREDDC